MTDEETAPKGLYYPGGGRDPAAQDRLVGPGGHSSLAGAKETDPPCQKMWVPWFSPCAHAPHRPSVSGPQSQLRFWRRFRRCSEPSGCEIRDDLSNKHDSDFPTHTALRASGVEILHSNCNHLR